MRAAELNRGEGVAAVASGERVAQSVADCDRALELLRVMARSGSVEERELARLSIDDVLDRRLELTRSERGRCDETFDERHDHHQRS